MRDRIETASDYRTITMKNTVFLLTQQWPQVRTRQSALVLPNDDIVRKSKSLMHENRKVEKERIRQCNLLARDSVWCEIRRVYAFIFFNFLH